MTDILLFMLIVGIAIIIFGLLIPASYMLWKEAIHQFKKSRK